MYCNHDFSRYNKFLFNSEMPYEIDFYVTQYCTDNSPLYTASDQEVAELILGHARSLWSKELNPINFLSGGRSISESHIARISALPQITFLPWCFWVSGTNSRKAMGRYLRRRVSSDSTVVPADELVPTHPSIPYAELKSFGICCSHMFASTASSRNVTASLTTATDSSRCESCVLIIGIPTLNKRKCFQTAEFHPWSSATLFVGF